MSETALYARVSTRGRDQDPETQLLKLREWAAQAGHNATEYVNRASGPPITAAESPGGSSKTIFRVGGLLELLCYAWTGLSGARRISTRR